MITISAFKWVPELRKAKGIASSWALEEALPRTRLSSRAIRIPGISRTPAFGQVPILQDDGFVLFEPVLSCSISASGAKRFCPKTRPQGRARRNGSLRHSIPSSRSS